MANLIISNVCDADCSYCFAKSYLQKPGIQSPFMSLKTFSECLDFLDRSGIEEVRLLGGEPTLHPQFPEMVKIAREHGKKVVIFSHGMIREQALNTLERLPERDCNVIINISARFPTSVKHKHVAASSHNAILVRLGKRAILGVNIRNPDLDVQPLLEMIHATGVQRKIRLGIALPGPGDQNTYAHPKQYRMIGQHISQQARLAANHGVTFDLDCGFVRCMFSEDDLDIISQNDNKGGWFCGPILDICPDRRVLHCFPLSDNRQLMIDGNNSASDLRNTFNSHFQHSRKTGIFRECSTCAYKLKGECSGGCLALVMRRFQPAIFSFSVPQYDSLHSKNNGGLS